MGNSFVYESEKFDLLKQQYRRHKLYVDAKLISDDNELNNAILEVFDEDFGVVMIRIIINF